MDFLDKRQHIEIMMPRNLPHWHQDEVFQFVTFRLADSLPQDRIQELREQIELFKAKHPEPWDDATRRAYTNVVGRVQNRLLDNGYGSCILAREDVRKIVADAILHYDDIKYYVMGYVIMPNHIHMLIRLLDDNNMMEIMHSLKSYTSLLINKFLGKQGTIWQKDYYDTIIRNDSHLRYCLEYILNNPRHLPPSVYTLFLKD